MKKMLRGVPDTAESRLQQPLTLAGRTYQHLRLDGRASAPDVLALRPLSTPLLLDGLEGPAADLLARELPFVEPVTRLSPGGRRRHHRVPQLGPGSAVGVEMMRGDFSAASTGTLTWRDGDRFLALGHGMTELGEVELPLTASYVTTLHPSYHRSVKFADQIATVGTITYDGYYAWEADWGESLP